MNTTAGSIGLGMLVLLVLVAVSCVLLVAWRQRRADPPPRAARLGAREAAAETQPIPTVGYNPARAALRRLREHDHELSTGLFRHLQEQPDTYTVERITADIKAAATNTAGHDDEPRMGTSNTTRRQGPP